jgi:hypothetical protein
LQVLVKNKRMKKAGVVTSAFLFMDMLVLIVDLHTKLIFVTGVRLLREKQVLGAPACAKRLELQATGMFNTVLFINSKFYDEKRNTSELDLSSLGK